MQTQLLYALENQDTFDSLYYNIHFIMVAWNATHNISKVCLYLLM